MVRRAMLGWRNAVLAAAAGGFVGLPARKCSSPLLVAARVGLWCGAFSKHGISLPIQLQVFIPKEELSLDVIKQYRVVGVGGHTTCAVTACGLLAAVRCQILLAGLAIPAARLSAHLSCPGVLAKSTRCSTHCCSAVPLPCSTARAAPTRSRC